MVTGDNDDNWFTIPLQDALRVVPLVFFTDLCWDVFGLKRINERST